MVLALPVMAQTRRVLVTGGAGFVGATLVRRLIASGHSVRVLDNYTTGDPAHLDGVGAELVQGDIRDTAALDAALAGMDSVIHLAAAGSVVMSVEDPVTQLRRQRGGHLPGAGRGPPGRRGADRPGLHRRRAHRRRHCPRSTSTRCPSRSRPYGASKLAGEGYAYAFAQCYGLRTVALRFANVYGPWSARKRGAMTTFFKRLHAGEPIVIYGDGSSSRDYIHVDDISRALQLALETDVPGGTVLHIASGVETTARELADLCRNAAGVPDHPVEFAPRRPGEVDRNFASYELAGKVLGYAPTISREDGIKNTWDWFTEHVFA